MEKKWRNLLILLVFCIVAVLLAVYLFSPDKGATFSDGVQQIISVWGNESINPFELTAEEIGLIDINSVSLVRQNLNLLKESPRFQDNLALNALADIHIAVADVIRTNILLSEKISGADSIPDESICGSIAVFEEINSLTKYLAEKTREKNLWAKNFISAYPEYSEQSAVEKFISDESALEASVQGSESGLQELKSSCGDSQ